MVGRSRAAGWAVAGTMLVGVPGLALGQGVVVRVALLPERTFVHSQVQLRVEVTHPPWSRLRWDTPAFEGMWPERLSTRGEKASDEPGGSLRTTVFRRALFPSRAGELEIPPSILHYRKPDGTEHALPVPGARLHVDPLPTDGRPEGFAGIVGKISVQAEVIRNPITSGKSTRLLVEVYGEANVWDLEPPTLEGRLTPDLEVFPGRPRLYVGEQGDRVTTRRTFVWDLVALRSGRFEIPTIAFPFFDPDDRRYRLAASKPLVLEVRAGNAAPDPKGPPRGPETPPLSGRALMLLALASALAGGVTTLFLVRWARRGAALRRVPSIPSPRAALEAARKGLGSERFPGLLTRAVKAGVTARHRIDAFGLTTEELARRIDDPEAIRILDTLDRGRFGRDGPSPEGLLASVSRYLSGKPKSGPDR